MSNKRQINVRLSDYDLGIIEVLKKHFGTNSTTEVLKRSLEYTALYRSGIPEDLVKKKG